jgi:hypothetical protein
MSRTVRAIIYRVCILPALASGWARGGTTMGTRRHDDGRLCSAALGRRHAKCDMQVYDDEDI